MPNMDGWKRSVEAEIQKVGQAATTTSPVTDEVVKAETKPVADGLREAADGLREFTEKPRR